MFDRLYKRQHAIARHQNGPLNEERRRYLAHCAEQQMSPPHVFAGTVWATIAAIYMRTEPSSSDK